MEYASKLPKTWKYVHKFCRKRHDLLADNSYFIQTRQHDYIVGVELGCGRMGIRLGKLGKLGNMTSIWQNGSRQVGEAKIVEGREHVALCGPAGTLDQIGKVLLIRAGC